MRILHVGTGYPPISGGGLTLYALDLMSAQAAAGHAVHYLCVGAFDLLFATRLGRWRLGDVRVHEVLNPRTDSIHIGRIERGALELSDPRTEKLVRKVLAEVRPDVVHFQSLLGWPASVVGISGDAGVPTVMTVQNYQCLCPTTRLYDEVAGEVCDDFAEGRRCVRCSEARLRAVKLRTIQRLDVGRRGSMKGRISTAAVLALRRLRSPVPREQAPMRAAGLPPAGDRSEMFVARRAAFVAALNRIHCVAGMSRRVSELLVSYGVEAGRVRTLHLVVGELDHIERRPPRAPGRPVRFGLLNKLTHLKGADVLREAWGSLDPTAARLLVFGPQSEAAAAAVRPLVERGVVELRGPYRREELRAVLSEIDVGLVPSIWEEPYGYVGLEFLAGGIPVLGSRIGGIPDYVQHGVNGLLLPPADPGAWREAIERLAANPSEVERLSRNIAPMKSFAEHAREIDGLYAEAIEACRGTSV